MKLEIINMENCYGIGKIQGESLDFSQTNSYLIYAQNGVFKTSFAKSLVDLMNNETPKDIFYPNRETQIDIEFNGKKISRENVAVFHSYDENFSSEDSVTTFMASSELKQQYDKILSELETKKKKLLKTIKDITGSSDCEKEIKTTFQNQNFYEILDINLEEIENNDSLYSFKYHDIFDKSRKVEDFINKHHDLLEEYFKKYQDLLSQSSIFKHTNAGDFGTNHADDLKKTLADDRFFQAQHSLTIADRKITNSKDLSDLIDDEKNRIVNDEELKEKFDKIEKSINANKDLKAFKEAISNDNTLLTKLLKYDSFRKEVFFSYLKQAIHSVKDLVGLYREKKPEIEKIVEQANEEQEKWKSIIETFNQRFFVPFRVELQNQEEILLGKETAQFKFVFTDDEQDTDVEKEVLQKHLSGGEKRALYILQILFEIEARKKSDEIQLLVFDDISDSFDYRNKYAIIEYLNDLQEYKEDEKKCNKFKMLVMTHNFDFYRTLASRLGIKKYTSMIHKNDNTREIVFNRGEYLGDFINVIKTSTADRDFFALIPFVRNLIEYTSFKISDDSNYMKLTSCLHIKEDTKSIRIQDISEVFDYVFGEERNKKNIEKNNTKSYLQAVYEIAEKIYKTKDCNHIELQNKIIFSIAIRLKAEEFMLSKLKQDFSSEKNQTRKLFGVVSGELSSEEQRIMQKVLMLTPENIHINSFMYEPILDTPLDHLLKCWGEIKGLQCPSNLKSH